MSAKSHSPQSQLKKPRSFGATEADWQKLKAIADLRSKQYGMRYPVTRLVEEALGEYIIAHNAEIGKAAKGMLSSMVAKGIVIPPNTPHEFSQPKPGAGGGERAQAS